MWLGGTSCSLRVMTQIIGSLMGSLAARIQACRKRESWDQSLPPQTCCKHTYAHIHTHTHWMRLKSIFFSLQSLYLCFLIHSQPSLEAHIRRLLHSAPPTPSLLSPHTHTHTQAHATLRTTIYPPPQSACGQTQNNNVISALKGAWARSLLSSQVCVTSVPWRLI